MENLTAKTSGWDKLAKLVEGQSVSGFSNRAAAGLLKLLINTKTNYSYKLLPEKLMISILHKKRKSDCFYPTH